MTVTKYATYVLTCDRCRHAKFTGEYSSHVHARESARASGWVFPEKFPGGKTKMEQSQVFDVCVICAGAEK